MADLGQQIGKRGVERLVETIDDVRSTLLLLIRDFTDVQSQLENLKTNPQSQLQRTNVENNRRLIGIRFSYDGFESAENIKFYNRYIRGFLRWYRTQAVWIQGGSVKRAAYLVVRDYLAERAMRMLDDELDRGGHFSFFQVNPNFVIREAQELDRKTKGYLRFDGVELGDPDKESCPMEKYRQVSIREYCIGTEGMKPCPYWDRFHCVYPKRKKYEGIKDGL